MGRHAQITQNISLQYLKKEVRDEVDILHADKHESLPQIDTIDTKFAMSLQYLKKS